MSSTQRVESINAVIHKYVNSHSSLMGFFNRIQAMLASELQRAEYRDYLENLSYNIESLASSRVFPKLIEYLKSVLTDKIFQIQKAQIDVCFEYNAHPIPFEQISLYDNISLIIMRPKDSSEKLSMKDEVQASFSTVDMIRNLREDNLNDNCEKIEHKISKQQVYEIHATSNKTVNTKTRSGDTYTCQNCLNDGHNARSCVAPYKTCNKSGHIYLKCPNKKNV
ncbi:protein far1-related sequence 5-like [Gigaspora margarita]|uniref:Protein far1-related sequence 5-like n=1 Tax=Gigaspora margarita TaxID=4874 RepID=A0A8H4EIE2_GIGMA|nr:protein far1-related sequence 5-like [Gigaspora margarita]